MSNSQFKPLAALSSQDDVLINFNERLGEWTYGLFYMGYSKSQNKKVMVKVIDLKKFPLQKSCLDAEISILKKLQSNNYVTKFVEYKYYKNTLTIVTDLCNQGNLKDYLKKNGPLSEDKALPLLLQMAYGLRGLFDAKFSHGALRPENILLNEENGQIVPKISNFLFAKSCVTETLVKIFPSDSTYLAPEVLKNRRFNPKSDIWALGMIYYEMLYGKAPYTGKDMKELEECIKNTKLEFPVDNEISESSTNFITKCLERNLDKRMDFTELMQHRLIFRGMFSKGNGTFKLVNEQFNEVLASNKNLMYGLRRENSSRSISSKSSALSSRGNKSAGKTQVQRPPTGQSDLLNKKILITAGDEAKDMIDIIDIKDPQEIKENKEIKKKIDVEIKALPLSKLSMVKSPSSAAVTDRPKSNQAPLKARKTQDPKFYESYLYKVGSPRDSLPGNLKAVHTQRTSSMSTTHSNFTKPINQLNYRTEVVGEIYRLIEETPDHPLYDSILKALERESQKLEENVKDVTELTSRFVQDVLQAKNDIGGRVQTESSVQRLSTRRTKSKSSMSKEKCKETYELLKEIAADIMDTTTNPGVNKESMVKIAANFKVLREFNAIGEHAARELEALKDILLVFYRKKRFDHVKYLLLVKNFV